MKVPQNVKTVRQELSLLETLGVASSASQGLIRLNVRVHAPHVSQALFLCQNQTDVMTVPLDTSLQERLGVASPAVQAHTLQPKPHRAPTVLQGPTR